MTQKKRLILEIIFAALLTFIGVSYISGQFNEAEKKEIVLKNEVAKANTENARLYEENRQLTEEINSVKQEVERLKETSRGAARGQDFIVTAYDLSVESCGKAPGHPGYGITASGFNLAGHTLESARAIAVDPNVIPIGSKVRISFTDDNMKRYDGVYTAVDTGGAIKGNRIDLYVGEDEHNLAYGIGRRHAKVQVL